MTARKQSATKAKKSVTKKKAATAKKATTAKKAVAKKTVAKKTVAKKVPGSAPYEQGKWAEAFARAPGERRYWLVKSEPDVFSFDDLLAAPGRTTHWDGVRNTAARNFLRDGMKQGDLVFYYHSMAEPAAIAGIGEVVREGYPDHTAFDPKSEYYDGETNPDTPTWFMVDIKAVRALARPVTLPELKANPDLASMALLRVSRLSVVPVTAAEWKTVLGMAGE